MAKDLMHVEFLIELTKLRNTLLYLKDQRAYNVEVHPYENPDDRVPVLDEKPRRSKVGLSTIAKSQEQQEWLAKHIAGKDTFAATDLIDPWTNAGYRGNSIYQALGIAIRNKTVKKVRPGVYKNIGEK